MKKFFKIYCITNMVLYVLGMLKIIFILTKDLETKNVFKRLDAYMCVNCPGWKAWSRKEKIGTGIIGTIVSPFVGIPCGIGTLIYNKLKK